MNFPEKLLRAQESGSLVVFAGAGVSMGSPSSLPNFRDLANGIAEGMFTLPDGEPEDRFLGRVARGGANVHERARHILDRPDSLPTNIHKAIVSLFNGPDAIRIVTTNFDGHFSSVLHQESSLHSVHTYKAPALPLGDDFQGLVYLHGTTDDPNRMVITDADFGKAYLTQGWATQFLRKLFQKYTVLFIGYSHQDVVMNYLARGLPPDGPSRFAMTAEGTSYDYWEYLGIEPVFFPLIEEPNRYEELESALVGWGERTQLSVLDHERRIQQLVTQSSLPVNLEDIDYLKVAIRHEVHVKFFTRHARSLHWLQWLANDPSFQRLFDPMTTLTPQEIELAFWFSDNFSCSHVYESLSIIERNRATLNKITWTALARRLWNGEPRPSQEILAQWIAVLIASPESTWDIGLANYLLGECDGVEESSTALILFEALSKPRLKLKPHIAFTESDTPRIRADFSLTGEDYWVREAWAKIFKPNIITFAPRIEPVLVNNIVSAHNSLRALGMANEEWDPISFQRSAIEPHEQDRYPDGMDILIDGLRDVLMCGMQDRNFIVSKATVFSSSGIPILKRLAVHMISETPTLASNAKIRWLLNSGWLYSTSLKHEVFRLLQGAYPSTSTRLRSELIRSVMTGPNTDYAGDRWEINQYEIFNMLVWLHQSAPECVRVEKALRKIQRENPDFREREHPDFSHWMGPVTWGNVESSVSVDEVLEMAPQNVVNLLLTTEELDSRISYESFLEAFTQAVQESFDKTWIVVENLKNLSEVPEQVWKSILRGWRETSLNHSQWESVLEILCTSTAIRRLSAEVAYLIQKGLNREEGRIPEQLFDAVEYVLESAWPDEQECRESESEADPPLTDARTLLDHFGGQLTLCWLYLLSWHRKNSPSQLTGISEKYRGHFARIISIPFTGGRSGRAMLAANLSFLFEVDSEWALAVVMPMFDWTSESEVVVDAWKGYLCAGRIHPDLVTKLAEWYVRSASMVDELHDVREQLCIHIAHISLYGNMNIDKVAWVLRCLTHMPVSERTNWARQLRWELQHADQSVIENVWTDFLKKYWSRRLLGFPSVLTSEETSEMIEWIPELLPVFPDVVSLMKETRVPASINGLIFHELKESTGTMEWPEELASLLLHLITGVAEPAGYYLGDIKGLVMMLIGKCSRTTTLSQICEQLARLGYPEAEELHRAVTSSSEDE